MSNQYTTQQLQDQFLDDELVAIDTVTTNRLSLRGTSYDLAARINAYCPAGADVISAVTDVETAMDLALGTID